MEVLVNFIEEHFLGTILGMMCILQSWNYYLLWRQRTLIQQSVDFPKSVEGIITKDTYDKARAYALDKMNFNIVANLHSDIINVIILLTYGPYIIWQWSVGIAKYCGINHERETLISPIYMCIINLSLEVLNLPLTVYYIFVLEEKYGFNKQTVWFFTKDTIKQFIVIDLILFPLGYSILWIIKNSGDYFYLYLWIFLMMFILLVMIIYPEVIAPLFDKYTPLPDGELKQKIEELAASLKFPLQKLFIVEGSVRSTHSNAYMYGFHKYKRIVLFDTLIKGYCKKNDDADKDKDKDKDKGCDINEILAILAHELGHWKHNHTLLKFIFGQVFGAVNILMFAKLGRYGPMYRAFGFTDHQPTLIGFIIVIAYIMIPLNTILCFINVVIQRKFEFQADKFATSLGHGQYLKTSLLKLQEDNLQFPLYDKLYSSWYHSHPSVVERLEAIDETISKEK
ncbi:CAAX prenyl protease 1 homolog [Harpegnathos saltator]|uniref:CAAX prenyl protease n=1 Tax=Harpegnathos saltator TaxID=610380 RepID=E2BE36_HARSA|nr:CAAX prenyl protease 1 homolog [Harpegnathos saltator]EFN86023.1 CAAX prenyl protease 1-like protein [Harpegnathos saltator]